MYVACFYIFFERLAYIRKAGKEDPLFMERIRDYIRTGEVKSAINYCRITNTPSARMIEKGISRMGRPVADVQDRKSTRLNSSHITRSRMPSSA